MQNLIEAGILAAEAWVPFWFESNQCWGRVDNPNEWSRMRAEWERAYELDAEPAKIYTAKLASWTHPSLLGGDARLPSYGFRREHDSDTTLGDFFDLHGMMR